jgi:hypothetical protein
MEKLITEFQDIFILKSNGCGWNDEVYHCIDTGDLSPICQPLHRLQLAYHAEVDKMLKEEMVKR